MATAPLLPLPNWAARPAYSGGVVGSAVGAADNVYVVFGEALEGEVLLLLLLSVDAEPFPDKEAEADAEERAGLYVMAVPLVAALEDPAASAVLVVANEEAEAGRLPELEKKGQWKGTEVVMDGNDDVAEALSESDEKGQWKGMEDDVPVPGEVVLGPWKGAEDG